jgi:LPS sulfotransferase NodH
MKFDKPAIIFCATQRSGSTMVVDDFQNVTGRKRSQTEAFYHLILKTGVATWDQAHEMMQKHRAPELIFFDKVMFHYLPRIAKLIDPAAKPGAGPFASYFADATWVYIRRANVFEQTISKYSAEKLNAWDARSAKSGFNDLMNFDVNLAKNYLHDFLQEDIQWLAFFKRHGITPIQIYYEDAVTHFPLYLDPVMKAAGIDYDPSRVAERRMEKLGNDRSAVLASVLQGMVMRDLISQSYDTGTFLREMQFQPDITPEEQAPDGG